MKTAPTTRCLSVLLVLAAWGLSTARAADVFVRFKVLEPPGEKFRVTAGGTIHVPNWSLSGESVEVAGGQWSRWLDLRKWPLHGRLDREGGLAEWPAMRLSLGRLGEGERAGGCQFEVQLADKPEPDGVLISFREKGGSGTIAFLLPHPLREKKGEFETGSQMTARHLAWAKAAAGGHAPALEKFDVITSVWGHYDPELARQATETLRLLGFNVSGGVPVSVLQGAGMRTYAATWHLVADPDESIASWKKGEAANIARAMNTPDGKWTYHNMAHYVIADEIQTMDFRRVDRGKLNRWFRDYLRTKGETDQSLGKPIEGVEYPAEAMYAKSLPRDADLPTRKVLYYAGKFGQWWSVKQLRQTTDLVRGTFADHGIRMKTETLPSDHSFFNAWGPPHCGMGYRGLDLFEIGSQRAVDVLSAEDWLGLNHMYGPSTTWTGAMAFGYLSAILRSGIHDDSVALRALITPSDDGYLRLKAYSALGQGAKSFFFWTFGPTYIGTENYWSDLRSEYDGIAKFTRALKKAEPILSGAKLVRDPVAILYSVSHDLWHTDDPASFVENRLTWVALRHLGVQPDFLREEDVEAGRLKDYKVLYITGQCITRQASAKIDDWVKAGGVVYLCAGAATRDEFYEPYLPPFAALVWPADATKKMIKQTGHQFNERVDLPTIKPITTATVQTRSGACELPVLGIRLDVRESREKTNAWRDAHVARFADGKAASILAHHGEGIVEAVGFMPGLAYSPFKVGQTTLDEKWPLPPREELGSHLIGPGWCNYALLCAVRDPVDYDAPIESSLLTGSEGSAIVLVNHGYKPIRRLEISLTARHSGRTAISTEGVTVRFQRSPSWIPYVGGIMRQSSLDLLGRTFTSADAPGTTEVITLEMPLEWTDIVLLPKGT